MIKRKYKATDGGMTTCRNWTVDFRDHHDIRRRIPAFSDRGASLELERNIKRLVHTRQAGGIPDAELNRFLEACPVEVITKLCKWGVLPGERAAAGKELARHIEDWRLELEARDCTRGHVRNFVSKVKAIAEFCGWRAIGDIDIAEAQAWQAEARHRGMSAATCNAYIRAAKGFCGWLVKVKRANENRLRYWALLNEKADRRKERHALTLDELGELLSAARPARLSTG